MLTSSLPVLTFVLTFARLSQAITLDDCPKGLHRDRYLQVHGDYCYYFNTFKSLDFTDSTRDCKSHGGHLPYVKDKESQDYLYSMLRTVYMTSEPVWIGLTDMDDEEEWEWLDGSKTEYSNWGSGQPGVVSIFEDCAAMEMDDGGKWHDFKCDDVLFVSFGHPYVCQYGPFKTTDTTKTMATTTPLPTTTPPKTTLMPTTERTTPTMTTTTTPMPTTQTTTPTTTTTPMPTTQTTTPTTTTTPMPTTQTTTPTTTTTPMPTTQTTTPTTTTTPMPTTQTTTPTTTTGTTACPQINCPNLNCGLDGFKTGPNGCFLCECDV